jgi:hypothetical protein
MWSVKPTRDCPAHERQFDDGRLEDDGRRETAIASRAERRLAATD